MIPLEKVEKIKQLLEDRNLELDWEFSILGRGGFGDVYKVRKKNDKRSIFAAKIIWGYSYKSKEKKLKFRGVNIININREIIDEDNEIYILIMELSYIGNLGKLNNNKFEKLYNEKRGLSFLNIEKEKRIFREPFVEKFGDNLTRFFTKQIISALKTFNQGNMVHFDIKPLNILLFKNLEIKLIDFDFLRKLDDESESKIIPGGTPGYATPEYFYKSSKDMEDEELRTQDYFALGATIFFLKYGKYMLNYTTFKKKFVDDNIIGGSKDEKERVKYKKVANELTGDMLVYCLDNAINFIKKQKYQDKNFDEFLCSLIQFKPKDRINFKKIMRNKWLNKNLKEIEKIEKVGAGDESNLLLELQKSDFIYNNAKHYRIEFDKLNEVSDKQYINNKKGKFKFGKKNKNKICGNG